MANESKQMNRLWLWVGAAVVLVAVFFTVRTLTRDRVPVHAAPATRAPLVSTISTNGKVEPEANYEIHSPVSTTVKAVYVQPGDQVAAGKLLMTLDDMAARARTATAESGVKAAEAAVEAATHNGSLQERQGAQADAERARLERDEAKRNLDALAKLNASGAASQGEVAGARARLQSAESSLRAADQSVNQRYSPAEVERARGALAEAQANLAAARDVQARTEVHAPIAGTIYSLNAGRTEFAEEGKLLIQIADLSRERVRAYFDEPEIGKLALGQAIEIRWDAKPGKIWHGHIERVPVTVNTFGTRNVGEVIVKVDDADGGLLPQTNVTVKVTVASEPNVLSIPREALHMEAGKPFVYRVAGNTLEKTPVTTGTTNLTQAAILTGLHDGDTVATGTISGQPLQEGIPIKVVR